MTHTELEMAYIALTEDVQRQARRIVGLCLANRTDAAGTAAVALSDAMATTREQYRMQQEQGNYNLSELRVNLPETSPE